MGTEQSLSSDLAAVSLGKINQGQARMLFQSLFNKPYISFLRRFLIQSCTSASTVSNTSSGQARVRVPIMPRHAQQLRDHDRNPCIAETDASRKCMDDNNYKKDMCTDYFLKYKNCRKFWHDIMMQRKRNGVKPEMPSAEERRKILESMEKPY